MRPNVTAKGGSVQECPRPPPHRPIRALPRARRLPVRASVRQSCHGRVPPARRQLDRLTMKEHRDEKNGQVSEQVQDNRQDRAGIAALGVVPTVEPPRPFIAAMGRTAQKYMLDIRGNNSVQCPTVRW